MQSLFRLEPDTNTGSIELRQWRYASEGLRQNVDKVEQFYRDYPIAVSDSHLLVRLIQTINISRTLPFDRYVANCSARSLNVAQALKITSALSKGQMWDGVFYAGAKEIILAHDTYFNLQDAYANWQDLQPITVLLHPESNTNLLIPDGRKNSLDTGVAVIAVNVPMLMAQYYRFNQEQDLIEQNGGARRVLTQFIHSYPLTNMIRSQLDSAVFNRLYNRTTGVPNVDAIRKHSFFLIDYDQALDTTAEQQLMWLRQQKRRFPGLMAATKLPICGDLWEFSKMPTVPYTLQVFWALTVARMKEVAFMCLAMKDIEASNKRELDTIRWLMKLHQTKQVVKNSMGYEAFYDVAPYFDIVGIE